MWGTFIALLLAEDMIKGVNRKDLPREQRVKTNQDFISFLGWLFLGLLAFGMIGGLIQLISPAFSQTTQRTYQDSMGRNVGRSSTDTRGNTTFYNERGQNTGRSSTQNGTTTIYNERGQQTGTIRSNR
jgi:hypothetical protein